MARCSVTASPSHLFLFLFAALLAHSVTQSVSASLFNNVQYVPVRHCVVPRNTFLNRIPKSLSFALHALLRLVPHIKPADNDDIISLYLYRLVLGDGDFGIHNMSITRMQNEPIVTYLVPAILSDRGSRLPAETSENALPSFNRVPDDVTPDNRAQYMTLTRPIF